MMEQKDIDIIKAYLKKAGVGRIHMKEIDWMFESTDVKYIILEHYNFPNICGRIFFGEITYLEILNEYFDDCNGSWEESLVYDVAKHKFFLVDKTESEAIVTEVDE